MKNLTRCEHELNKPPHDPNIVGYYSYCVKCGMGEWNIIEEQIKASDAIKEEGLNNEI